MSLGIHTKPVKLIKLYLNETYIKVCIGKHLSDTFRIQNDLEQGVVLKTVLSTLL
jgi:hypothetical protein